MRSIQFKEVDGTELPVVELWSESRQSRLRITVDNLRGYILRRAESYRGDARHPTHVVESVPRAYGDVWFLDKRIITNHVQSTVDADVPTLDFRRTYTFGPDFRINASIDPGVFTMAALGAQKGDLVVDDRSSPPLYMIYGEPPLDEAALRRRFSDALALAVRRGRGGLP